MVKFKDWTDLTYVVSRIRIAAKGDRYSIGGEKNKSRLRFTSLTDR